MPIRIAVLIIPLALLGAGCAIYLLFARDMRAAHEALHGKSHLINTVDGAVEYAEQGTGLPLLSIHGAGGGFDQGLANATSIMGSGFRVISPSRFGYLRTPIPQDVSPAAQADAHAALLDTLGIPKVIALGTSAGTRSALEFALRYPDRIAALVLVVPATYHPGEPASEGKQSLEFPLVLWLANAGADLGWWLLETIAPETLIRFIGVPPEVVRAASTADQAAVATMMRSIQPLSARFAGINIDSNPDLNILPLSEIKTPTLIITARDDLFGTLPAAQYAASQIPGARLIVYESGGHLLVGQGDAVRSEIADFLRHVGPF